MISPLSLKNSRYLVHDFRPQDLKRFAALSKDVYAILSDEGTLKFIPDKRLSSVQHAEAFLQEMVISFHVGRNYLHFISDLKTGRVVGMINIISPELARAHYQIPRHPFFIEFYLGSFASGCYLMTEILPLVMDQLLVQGINSVGAVVSPDNLAAKKVLKKANFAYKGKFDLIQDYFEVGA